MKIFIAIIPIMILIETRQHIHEKIEGKWREYFPFNLIQFHPDMDTHRTIHEICENENYDLEENWVTTEDGYINKLFRLVK